MEDFGGIIWTIVVIGFAVYSMAAQQRKKAGKGAGKPAHGEAWPAWDPEPEPCRQAGDTSSEIRPETYGSPELGKVPESIRENRREMTAAQQPQVYTGRLAENATGSDDTLRQGASRGAAESRQPPHHEDSEDLTADFDLRKAVIYSEILKPKFDENE